MTTSPPLPEGVRIRRAERADLLSVVRIESASFPQPWPANAFEPFLGQPGFLVAVDEDERVVGYAVADAAAAHGRLLGHLKDIAVHPGWRGEGIGTALLRRVLATLRAEGAKSVTLEVRESNEPAIELYRRFGFEPFRRQRAYYEDDEDAVVMILDLDV